MSAKGRKKFPHYHEIISDHLVADIFGRWLPTFSLSKKLSAYSRWYFEKFINDHIVVTNIKLICNNGTFILAVVKILEII